MHHYSSLMGRPKPQQLDPLRSTFYQVRLLIISTIFTLACVLVTIIYAYNATLTTPISPALLPSNPAQTIRILNILSHVTVFLLQTLTIGVFEVVRWVFAARTGVSAFTFLSLSSGTSFLGVLYLLFQRAHAPMAWASSHHVWGFQRYICWGFLASDYSIFLLLLHLGIGFALLTQVSIQVTWTDVVSSANFTTAGLSPFDTSIFDVVGALTVLPVMFWSTFPSVLSDGRYVTTVPPYTQACSSDPTQCLSLFLPGGRTLLHPPPPSSNRNASATALVVHDAPGAQIEFYPPSKDDPTLYTSNCQHYGNSDSAVQLCLQSVGNTTNSFIAGLIHARKLC
jgi:hypothetical protein